MHPKLDCRKGKEGIHPKHTSNRSILHGFYTHGSNRSGDREKMACLVGLGKPPNRKMHAGPAVHLRPRLAAKNEVPIIGVLLGEIDGPGR